MLSTPIKIKTPPRKLYIKVKQAPGFNECAMTIGACLGMKNIGSRVREKLYARFDKGGQANMARIRPLRHRQTIRGGNR